MRSEQRVMDGGVQQGGWPGRLASTLGVCLVLCACKPPTVSLAPPPHAYTPEDYESVYRAWTREATPFDFEQLESVLRVTATLESPAFRWAYVVRYAEDFGLTVDERTALLHASLEDADAYHRFFVTLASGSDRDLVELTHKRTAWRVLLVDDRGRQTEPLAIDRIASPTPAQATYFPSVSPWRRAFRIAFPVVDEHGEPTVPEESLFAMLRFTGPRGTVDLTWRFPLDERRRRRLQERRERRQLP